MHLVNVPGLPCPFLVCNLEDAACHAAKQLEPADPGLLLTQEKAGLFSTWLLREGLDSDPVGKQTLSRPGTSRGKHLWLYKELRTLNSILCLAQRSRVKVGKMLHCTR